MAAEGCQPDARSTNVLPTTGAIYLELPKVETRHGLGLPLISHKEIMPELMQQANGGEVNS